MNKQELIKKLKEIAEESGFDCEESHIEADKLLLQYINDPEIAEAFDSVNKWYA